MGSFQIFGLGYRVEGNAIALQASFATGRDAGLQLRGSMPRGVRMLSCLSQLESGLLATYKASLQLGERPSRLHPPIDIVLEDPILFLHLPLNYYIHNGDFSAEGPS